MVTGERCYGCSACIHKCPENAITFIQDKELFRRIRVDMDQCIGCGICDLVCPINSIKLKAPVAMYVGYHTQKKEVLKSASGGAAQAFSQYMIENNGYICGVEWNKDFSGAHHIIVKNKDSIKKIQGVKYVQSDPGNTFAEINILLQKKRQILFFGTPCECAGLKKYVGEENENLLTCELICQGTTTDAVLSQWIQSVSKGGRIERLFLRYQDFFHRDSEHFIVLVEIRHRIFKLFEVIKKLHFDFAETDYGYAFFNYKRPECYQCQFKGGSVSDITIGDCWRIDKAYPFYNKTGTSLIVCNTKKGREFVLNQDQLHLWEADMSVLDGNQRWRSPIPENEKREKFKDMFISKGLKEAVSSMRPKTWKTYVSRMIPWYIKKNILHMGKRVIPYDETNRYRRLS